MIRPGTYLSLSYNLPTRAYYPLLKDLDESEMRRVVTNIYLYGLLQLLSFVLLNFVLLRRLRIAAHHQVIAALLTAAASLTALTTTCAADTQVAFVLREHWQFVQCNLVLWMVYTIQSSLEHVGAPDLLRALVVAMALMLTLLCVCQCSYKNRYGL
jgi:hypothetical protein